MSEIRNILIAAVQVPFTRGGAEILVEGLRRELVASGYRADVVQLPFNAKTHEDIVRAAGLWRSLDLTEFNGQKVDLVITTKFPSYFIRHPRKVVWLIHQHRQMYELYATRFGDFSAAPDHEAVRRVLTELDRESLSDCVGRYSISQNVSDRLDRFLGLQSEVLYPPLPLGNRYRSGEKGDYILSVGRICSIKRVDLLVKSLPLIADGLKVKVVGAPDEPGVERYLQSEIDKHHLWHRIEFLGRVSDEVLVDLYSNAFAVYYAPYDEDYGFVTLEALASSKPVVTASDSGGTLAFISDGVNGLIAEPSEKGIAACFNELYANAELYTRLVKGAEGSERPLSWNELIGKLTDGDNPSRDSSGTAVQAHG